MASQLTLLRVPFTDGTEIHAFAVENRAYYQLEIGTMIEQPGSGKRLRAEVRTVDLSSEDVLALIGLQRRQEEIDDEMGAD